jgi:Fur family zinc uptake transcriptional regulator
MPTKVACGHQRRHLGLKGAELQQRLSVAETRCFAANEVLTPPRRQVLTLLLAAHAPVKAYDLMAALSKAGGPAYPITTYRALEFLMRLGFAHRIERLNAYVACRMDEGAHSPTLLICDCCGAVEEWLTDIVQALAGAEPKGYVVRAVTVEARGLCGPCMAGKLRDRASERAADS